MKSSTLLLIAGGFIVLAILGGGLAVSSLPGGYPGFVTAFANAIATAEGFFVNGSRPQRNNNPGDIMSGGSFVVYNSISDGWNALYNQVSLMFTGGSSYYNPSMTIGQVAQVYVDGPNATGMSPGATAWMNNVASVLGVSPGTTLATLMGA